MGGHSSHAGGSELFSCLFHPAHPLCIRRGHSLGGLWFGAFKRTTSRWAPQAPKNKSYRSPLPISPLPPCLSLHSLPVLPHHPFDLLLEDFPLPAQTLAPFPLGKGGCRGCPRSQPRIHVTSTLGARTCIPKILSSQALQRLGEDWQFAGVNSRNPTFGE